MKEKIKKILKNKYFKIIVFILLGLFILRESYAVYIDIYNFGQLEKAKPYLETIDENTKDFYNLKEFNERYNAGIKPIKNCYILSNEKYFYSNSEAKSDYIFGFKLESKILNLIYSKGYYVYPESKYEGIGKGRCQEYGGICGGDLIFLYFNKTISNPCKD